MRWTRAVLGVVLWFWAVPVAACPVCIDFAERTMADGLIGDPVAVLARPDPADLSRFAVVEVVNGIAGILPDLPPIPFAVDDATSMALAADPEAAVLMSYSDSYAGTGWQRTLLVTPGRRAFVDAILDAAESWDWEMTQDPARVAFFAARLGDPDPEIARVAAAELARAPYAMTRQIALPFDGDAVLERIAGAGSPVLERFHILLLGLVGDAPARAAVEAGVAQALAQGGPATGAWALAATELDRDAAIARIAARLAEPGNLSSEDLRGLRTALTEAGTGLPELRGAVTAALLPAAESDPAVAAELAYSFYAWQDWSMAPAVRAMLEAGDVTDHAQLYILKIYLNNAAAAGQ